MNFIERTILSVISQEWDFDLEYIIMDWWSNDWTLEIIKKYDDLIKNWKFLIKCNNISYIWKSEKDKWQSDAINKWLSIATWDILAYINSDDTYVEWAFKKVIENLWNSNKLWSYWKCRIINEKDEEIRKFITFYKNILGKRYSYWKLLAENFISQMTVFWKKSIMEKVWFFNEKEHLCMDYEYWLRLGKFSDPLYIDDYIANFRFYFTSKSWANFVKQFNDELRIAKKFAKDSYKFSIFLHRLNRIKILLIYGFLNMLKV